jgi:hypothetical protein
MKRVVLVLVAGSLLAGVAHATPIPGSTLPIPVSTNDEGIVPVSRAASSCTGSPSTASTAYSDAITSAHPDSTDATSILLQNGADPGSVALVQTALGAGVPLSALTTLSYDTYVNAPQPGNEGPFMSLSVSTDGSSGASDVLVYEPRNNAALVVPTQWQQWNALAGNWYSVSAPSSLFTLLSYITAHPFAKIVDGTDSTLIWYLHQQGIDVSLLPVGGVAVGLGCTGLSDLGASRSSLTAWVDGIMVGHSVFSPFPGAQPPAPVPSIVEPTVQLDFQDPIIA